MNLSQAFSIKVFVPLMVVVIWMASCLDQSSVQPPLNPVFKPGDQIDIIVLTTTTADAAPRLAQFDIDTYTWTQILRVKGHSCPILAPGPNFSG